MASSGEHTNGKMEGYLLALQRERQKIEAFKRELPCCMDLLDRAIESTRGCLEATYEAPKMDEVEEKLKLSLDNSSTSLLVQPKIELKEESTSLSPRDDDMNSWMQLSCSPTPSPGQETRQRKALGSSNSSGAFTPFARHKKWDEADLTLSPFLSSNLEQNDAKLQPLQPSGTSNLHQQRKARRCWSPELHRRFVAALQHLGGSQVATPKQIRELMKVEGLTNDEVKSHLQKYRLHTSTRRPAPVESRAAVEKTPHQLVVLGSIWFPQEYAAAVNCNNTTVVFDHHPVAAAMSSNTVHQQIDQAQDFLGNLQSSQAVVYDQKQELFSKVLSSTNAAEEEDDGDVTEAEDNRSSSELVLQIATAEANLQETSAKKDKREQENKGT